MTIEHFLKKACQIVNKSFIIEIEKFGIQGALQMPSLATSAEAVRPLRTFFVTRHSFGWQMKNQNTLLISVAALIAAGGAVAAPNAALTLESQGGLGGTIQKQIETQLPKPNPLPAPGPEPAEMKELRMDREGVQVLVKGFRIEGAKSLPDDEIQQVLADWLNRSLTMVELQDAADAVAKQYAKTGLLAKTFFPPQSVGSDQVILLKIVEAKLAAVKVEAGGESVRFDQETAIAYITHAVALGQLVNTKRIEAAVAIMEEMPGVSVKPEIRPTETEGEVELVLLLSDKPFFSGASTLSNNGNASTGHVQVTFNGNLNNSTGFGDLLSLDAFKSEGSTFGKLSWTVPVGYEGLKLGVNASSMTYTTVGSFVGYEGASNAYALSATYPMLRSVETNFNASVSYDAKEYRNNIVSGSSISSYNVKDLVFGITGNNYDAIGLGGVSTGSLSMTFGRWDSNTWSDANSPGNYGQYNPFNYSKLNYSLSRSQQILQDETILVVSLSGQFASDNLDSVEKFYLGGPSGVRAYPVSQGGGDEGMLLNIELQHQLQPGLMGYVFLDYGQVRQYKSLDTYALLVQPNTTNAPNLYALGGVGFGVNFVVDKLVIKGTVGLPIGDNPLFAYNAAAQAYVAQNNDGEKKRTFAWITLSYSF